MTTQHSLTTGSQPVPSLDSNGEHKASQLTPSRCVPAGIPVFFPGFLQLRVRPRIAALVTTILALVLWCASCAALIHLYFHFHKLLTQDPRPSALQPALMEKFERLTLALVAFTGLFFVLTLANLVVIWIAHRRLLKYLYNTTIYLSLAFIMLIWFFAAVVVWDNPIEFECNGESGCPLPRNFRWWKVQVIVGVVTVVMIVYSLYHSSILFSYKASLPPREVAEQLESGKE